MAFKFQINKDIKFSRNNEFLETAQKNKPQLFYQEHFAQRCVKIFKGTDQLETTSEDISILKSKIMGKNNYLILDFGDHFVGHFSIGIEKHGSLMDAPLTLKIQFAERPNEFFYDSSNYKGWLSSSWISEETVHIDQLPTKLKLPRRYSFRYVKITVMDTSPKWKVSFNSPKVVSESSVDESNLPEFNINDPELRQIGKVSLKTLAECMQDVFEDGPKRDQRLWLGDLHLQALVNYATFKNYNLVKRCLYLFAGMTTSEGKLSANIFTNNQLGADDTFLFDYSLFFVSCLKDYLDATQDRKAVVELYNVAKNQIDLASKYVSNDGELMLPEDWPVFIDWGDDEDKSTAAQAVFIKVLKDFIKLNDQLNIKIVDKYSILLKSLINYSIQELFDQKNGLFTSKGEVNIYSQIWMVLARVLPKEENIKLMNNTYKKFFPIKNVATPYMYHFIVEALLQTDMRTEGIQLIKDYWGKMISMGTDTFWEAFKPNDPDFSPYGSPLVNSYCHAWSCTPIYLIKKYDL